MNKAQKVNIRAIVSILLFFLIIILFLTAVGMQILEDVIDSEITVSLPPDISEKLYHIITAIHVLAGYIFCGLSIVHIIKNRKALKSYFKNNMLKNK